MYTDNTYILSIRISNLTDVDDVGSNLTRGLSYI